MIFSKPRPIFTFRLVPSVAARGGAGIPFRIELLGDSPEAGLAGSGGVFTERRSLGSNVTCAVSSRRAKPGSSRKRCSTHS
jgi:hypothetical protein